MQKRESNLADSSTGVSLFGRTILLVESQAFKSIVDEFCSNLNQSALFCNVHMLMLSTENPALAEAMDNASHVFADGRPISWLQRRLSKEDAITVVGYKFLQAVCAHAVETGKRVGFFGSTRDTLLALNYELSEQFPGLNIDYLNDPPYSQGELITSDAEIDKINASEIDFLFVGLGCPKQEIWIHRYGPGLNCSLLGVGAAFDWLAGTVRKPPRWMENSGLGWLFRLLQNPRRMWHRYLKYNTKFVLKVTKLLFWDNVWHSRK